ncbi:MAG: chemotaxis protein CheX [Bryobacteraceae bacterium]
MIETALSEALREAVDEVLEKMFFVQSEGQAAPDRPPEELVAARVDFEGSPSGTLSLRVTLPAAHRMAADFLGEEASELPATRTTEVVCELANMICGSVLSRVEGETAFRLSAPLAAVEMGEVVEPSGGAIVHNIELSGGAFSVKVLCTGASS